MQSKLANGVEATDQLCKGFNGSERIDESVVQALKREAALREEPGAVGVTELTPPNQGQGGNGAHFGVRVTPVFSDRYTKQPQGRPKLSRPGSAHRALFEEGVEEDPDDSDDAELPAPTKGGGDGDGIWS